MLRRILIGLDGTDYSRTALKLGLQWARAFEARIAGWAVVDEPGVFATEPVRAVGGRSHQDPVYRQGYEQSLVDLHKRADNLLAEVESECSRAGIACERFKDVGDPPDQLLLEAQRVDLILLGMRTYFRFKAKDGPDDTLSKVLQDSPRPVVAVPKTPEPGDAVVVAYDGSLQAARAVYGFVATGLGYARKVHVVSVGSENQDVTSHAQRAIAFLGLHGIACVPHILRSSDPPDELIMRAAREEHAGLLVMGAYGQSKVREFFLGSVTRRVLAESLIPVFCTR
jgi:nucleotide-binding universal stress UspA family protein